MAHHLKQIDKHTGALRKTEIAVICTPRVGLCRLCSMQYMAASREASTSAHACIAAAVGYSRECECSMPPV